MKEPTTDTTEAGRRVVEAGPVRVGVIGCGRQGQRHLKAFRTMAGVEIVAIADVDGARLEEAGSAFGVERRFTDGRHLLDLGLDLVSVCTMPSSHARLVGEALAAGSHVICEKPFARHVTEALEMATAADRADRMLAVGFNTRYLSPMSAVREFVNGGAMGTWSAPAVSCTPPTCRGGGRTTCVTSQAAVCSAPWPRT